MKIKGVRLAAVVGVSLFALAGCSSQTSSSSQNSASTSQKTTKKQSTQKRSTVMWSVRKNNYLENFMEDWQGKMNQSYKKYDGTNALKTSAGMSYPSDLSKVKVNGSKQSIGWSKNGTDKYKYNVVSIYNYDGNNDHITYFFAFHNKKTIALVDQSSGGTPDLKETENNDVKSEFEDIADGKSYSTPDASDTDNASDSQSSNGSSSKGDSSNSKSTDSVSDPKIIGVLVYEQANSWYDPEKPDSDWVMRYNPYAPGKYSIGGGSAESDVQYSIQGDAVHYQQLDPDSSDVTADETMEKSTVSLRSLISKYYSTDEQKQVVQKTADDLQDMM
ncbi:Lreu_0056 family protein [Companilactobacillus versmoldensis]|uniref:Uncharacterized protein n=1 Tax=Companilactobacillus versmoldensis DSM 14857 = KCTC 3814 TaxID=1423815 RepID=A0A0R1SP92_9LACO|nr:DUF4767 domain-containing protein [Companilactobacillus versmoldensis]KRL66891.1 hypothetical protein FC27_GL000337 [Companilactobacillus versmoldensis DSM 14857 = KCTC 3814]